MWKEQKKDWNLQSDIDQINFDNSQQILSFKATCFTCTQDFKQKY